MSKKIFNLISTLAFSVLFVTLIVILGVTYRHFNNVFLIQLKHETRLAARGVELSGMQYLENLDHGKLRLTWIGADGTVLFDSEADSTDMENHLKREEVIEARETGSGESFRYSKTLSEKHYYEALLLSDGSVLRLSDAQNTIWILFLGFGRPISVVILFAIFLSVVLASRLANKIVEPINRIDPENPEAFLGTEEYEEIRPLLLRMNAQQKEIRRSRDELEKTSRIRQEFTANASHELKTPLHTISGYAELLESDMVKGEDIRHFAGKIREEARRMSRLVGDIIDLSKLDGEIGDMEKQEVDILQIARNALDSVQAAAEVREISLSLSGDEAVIFGVPQILYSMIYNLCDNAVKYNRPRGSVELTVKDSGKAVILEVSDTGVGIPPEYQSRIFERFFRVDQSRSAAVDGTGLGLSIVKHGAMLHDASITVESVVGYGTTFTLSFPK